jgi:hypothetical protein
VGQSQRRVRLGAHLGRQGFCHFTQIDKKSFPSVRERACFGR